MAGTAQGGQRRDLNATVRALRAIDLIADGYTYAEAAAAVGYGSSGACWHAVDREIQRDRAARVEHLRHFARNRLRRLRRVYMPKALAGDGWSADRVVRFDEREAALMGLDAGRDGADAGPPQVKVIRRGGSNGGSGS